MKHNIDARGLACPQPVILTRNCMKDHSEIDIIVDNQTAVENIKRLAENSGWNFKYVNYEENFKISISSSDTVNNHHSNYKQKTESSDTIFVFTSDKMGRGDDELGSLLIKAFIHTIASQDISPSKLIFYNSGVKLAVVGSGVDDDLELLHGKGVEILICGTCLNYFNLADHIKTGTISNMFDILDSLNNADKIINP